MTELLTPIPISVKAANIEVSSQYCSTRTDLFRAGTYLPAGLRETYDRNPGKEVLRIRSVGCSIGAEADSITAIHNKLGHGETLDLLGLDINREAVAAAREGVYRAPVYNEGHTRYIAEILEEYGFGFNVDRSQKELWRRAYYIDGNPVREGHSVQFAVHDITREPADSPPADLVLANNVLYHLGPVRSVRAVRNLASMLSPNGVLSIDYETMLEPIQWRGDITGVLAREFGMQPIKYSSAAQPVMFARQ